MSDRTVISICGPSGAGKSQLAKGLVAELGEGACARVPADYFIAPIQGALSEALKLPVNYDWERLEQTIRAPLGETVTAPRFDFTTFTRTPNGDSRSFVIRPMLVVDAMYPFSSADLTVLLDLDAPERMNRIVRRDQAWGAHVHERWEQLAASGAYLRTLPNTYDLLLSGAASIDENVHRIILALDAPLEPGGNQ